MNIELRPLNESNKNECINLKVIKDQEQYIATNEDSIAAAKKTQMSQDLLLSMQMMLP